MTVGDYVIVAGLGTCQIVRIWPLGTVDVMTEDGHGRKAYYRVTGLQNVRKDGQ